MVFWKKIRPFALYFVYSKKVIYPDALGRIDPLTGSVSGGIDLRFVFFAKMNKVFETLLITGYTMLM